MRGSDIGDTKKRNNDVIFLFSIIYKDRIFTYINKAHEICRGVNKGYRKRLLRLLLIQMAKDHKDLLDDTDITTLKPNIDSE